MEETPYNQNANISSGPGGDALEPIQTSGQTPTLPPTEPPPQQPAPIASPTAPQAPVAPVPPPVVPPPTEPTPTEPEPEVDPFADEQAKIKQAEYDKYEADQALQARAQYVQSQIEGISNGSIPLNPGQQAQVDGLKLAYNELIEQQKLVNQGASGLGNIRGYQTGAAEYDPTFQVKTIGSIITAGINKVAALNTKMASAVGELTEAFKDKNIERVKEAWGVYKEANEKRTTALKDTIENTQKAIKDAKDAIAQQEKDYYDRVTKPIEEVEAAVAKNNAPQEVRKAVADAKRTGDYSKVVAAAGQYLQSENDRVDILYKRAQINKIYADMANDAEAKKAGFSDPMELIAYANQYAATGQIPTGLPKGAFGVVAAVAKNMPKQPGQVIDTKTGVTPSGAGEATLAGYSALYSAIELSKELKELDEKRMSGLAYGTVGKIFGDADQQRYVDLRSQIVDLLARARSGAALTESEEARYSGMLPSRFSEPFYLGADSGLRIDNFANTLTKDLTNKVSSRGWAVNGLSKVEVDGQTYTVGDIVEVDGQNYRINADKSATPL